jgi:hypothetical protein
MFIDAISFGSAEKVEQSCDMAKDGVSAFAEVMGCLQQPAEAQCSLARAASDPVVEHINDYVSASDDAGNAEGRDEESREDGNTGIAGEETCGQVIECTISTPVETVTVAEVSVNGLFHGNGEIIAGQFVPESGVPVDAESGAVWVDESGISDDSSADAQDSAAGSAASQSGPMFRQGVRAGMREVSGSPIVSGKAMERSGIAAPVNDQAAAGDGAGDEGQYQESSGSSRTEVSILPAADAANVSAGFSAGSGLPVSPDAAVNMTSASLIPGRSVEGWSQTVNSSAGSGISPDMAEGGAESDAGESKAGDGSGADADGAGEAAVPNLQIRGQNVLRRVEGDEAALEPGRIGESAEDGSHADPTIESYVSEDGEAGMFAAQRNLAAAGRNASPALNAVRQDGGLSGSNGEAVADGQSGINFFGLSTVSGATPGSAVSQGQASVRSGAGAMEKMLSLAKTVSLFDRLASSALEKSDGLLKIWLEPANLGKMTMLCREEDGRLTVDMVVENGHVRDYLVSHESRLRDVLAGSGYNLSGFQVKTGGGDGMSGEKKDGNGETLEAQAREGRKVRAETMTFVAGSQRSVLFVA